MKTLFTSLLLLYSILVNAQAPAIEWQKCLGGNDSDLVVSITSTQDGGYIMAGNSISNDGDVIGNPEGNYWILKTDAFGNISWQKSLGGSGQDNARSVQQTQDGGYIIAGNSWSNDGDVSGNHGNYDYWIVKLDTIGNIIWQKCLGGSSYDYVHSIVQTQDGGYIVAGESVSNDGDVSGNHGSYDYWIVKLDMIGDVIWQKCLGGNYYDGARSIQQTLDGGYIVAGESASNDGDVSGNHGYDYWIVKLDTIGNITWQKCLGGSYQDFAYSVAQTTDGGYIVAGHSTSNDGDVSGNHGSDDYWIVKLDVTGNITWQKCLGGSDQDLAYSVAQTTDGGYIIAGNSWSNDGDVSGNHGSYDYWIVQLDSTGAIFWQKSLGGNSWDEAYSMVETQDGGYLIAGGSRSNNGNVSGNHGNYDCWIVKLSFDTNIVTNTTEKLNHNAEFLLYPNPSTTEITIESPTTMHGATVYQITDLQGRIILQGTLNSAKTILNIQSLAEGVYVLKTGAGVQRFEVSR